MCGDFACEGVGDASSCCVGATNAAPYWVSRYLTPSSAAFGALNIVPVAFFSSRCSATWPAMPIIGTEPTSPASSRALRTK